MTKALCGKHAAETSAWSGYRLTPSPQIVQIGTLTVARIREQREMRFRQWRDTIRSQQTLIEKCCAAGQHCGEAADAFQFSALEQTQ